jgi:hypothetical protein
MEKKEVKAVALTSFSFGWRKGITFGIVELEKKLRWATVIAANLSLKMELNDFEKSN